MSDPWTAAWQEAEATAPPTLVVFCTLELIHPAFVDEFSVQFPIRAVTGTVDDQTLTLEVGALFDSGAAVVFKAIPFMAERPTYEEGRTPECLITLDNVARELAPYLENAVIMRADVVAIYREWRSDDTTAPCFGPVQFVIKQ